MIKKFAISSIIAASMLLACSDVTDSRTDPLSPTASVSVSVIDAVTGEPVKGAEVSVLTLNNGKRSTNAEGKVYYDDVHHGNYEIVVTKKGYVGLKQTGLVSEPTPTHSIAGGDPITNTQALFQSYYIAGNTYWTVSLPPTTGSIDGTVLYYTDALNTNMAPAAGAKVRADLANSNLLDRQFETTADENGYFRFNDLPAGTVDTYSISVLNYESDDGITTFYATPVTSGLTIDQANANNPVSTGTTVLTSRARVSDFRLVSWTRTVTGSDPIEVYFSDEVDTTLILRSNISISTAANIDVKWEGNKLTVTPRDPWNTSATTMTLAFGGVATLTTCVTPGSCLTSVKGQTIVGASNPVISILPTNISDEAVKGLKRYFYAVTDSIDWNSTGPIRLRWNSVKGATGYQVYYRYSRNAETSKAWATFGSAITGTTKGGIVDTTFNNLAAITSGILYEGDVVQFLVIAYNSMYQTKFEGAAVETIKDELGPKMSTAPAATPGLIAGTTFYVWGNPTDLKAMNDTTTTTIDEGFGLGGNFGTGRIKADTICLTGGYITQEAGTVAIPKTGLTFTEPVDTVKTVAPLPTSVTGGRTITPFLVWNDNTNAGNATANICYVTSPGAPVPVKNEVIFAFQLFDKAGLKQRFQFTGDRQWRDSVYTYVNWQDTPAGP